MLKNVKFRGTNRHHGKAWLFYLFLVLRFMQIVLSATLVGLYADDIAAEDRAHTTLDLSETYALCMTGLSAFWALLTWYPAFGLHIIAWVDFALMIGFSILTYLFSIANPIQTDIGGGTGLDQKSRMRHATLLDLIVTCLWIITFVYLTSWSGVFRFGGCNRHRRNSNEFRMSDVPVEPRTTPKPTGLGPGQSLEV